MRCATNGAICAGGTPSVVSEIENFASEAASTTSPPHIRPSPPPYAAPSTTITIVCGSSSNRDMIAPKRRLCSATPSRSPAFGAGIENISLKPLMSPPAQNVLFAPRTTAARIS